MRYIVKWGDEDCPETVGHIGIEDREEALLVAKERQQKGWYVEVYDTEGDELTFFEGIKEA